MLERYLTSPWAAIGLIILVLYLAGIYITQRERAKVQRMRGPRRFSPEWSSGRRHKRKRRSTSAGRFSPQWTSRSEREGADSPSGGRDQPSGDGGGTVETGSGDPPSSR